MQQHTPIAPEQILTRHDTDGTTYSHDFYPQHIARIVEVLAPRRWLDVGCNRGQLFRATKGYWQEAVGVEMNPTAAAAARPVASQVLASDFESAQVQLATDYPGGFDLISFNDVLEHMYNPWQAIAQAKKLLAPGGILLLQVPNISHYSVIRELLGGRFDYQSAGLLDATHIRFFTPETFREAAERNGLNVVKAFPRAIVQQEDQDFVAQLARLGKGGAHLTCFQYCLVCTCKNETPDSATSDNAAIHERLQRADNTLAALLGRIEQAIEGSQHCVDNEQYQQWLALMQMRNAEAEALLRRTQTQWTQMPGFTLFVHAGAGELALLADTLDTLPLQRYPRWRVVVLSDAPCPDAMFDGGQLCWQQVADLADGDALAALENSHLDADPDGWFARLPAGSRLSPEWLLTLTDYINAQPQRTVFYCDHDRVHADGMRSEPWFKPGFDADYLYAIDYIGPALAFSNRAVLSAGGVVQAGPWSHLDSLLKLVEAGGTGAVAHIAKMLLSLPAGYRLPDAADARARSAISQAHFARRGVAAEVKPGFIDGTLRVDYLHPAQPLVSIIIPNRDKIEYLEPCVDSLIANTAWPNWELLIVDNQSEDPDTLAYYQQLQERLGERVRIVPFDAPFNFSAQCNLGVEQAQGEYVLLLNNDTQIIQPQWLTRMMAHAQRPEVGAVGCRLAYPESGAIQHAGISFNFHQELEHIADHPFAELARGDAGYMQRAWVEQGYAAVTAACLLSRKSLYRQIGGLDAEHLAVLFNDVDYCLRLGEAGYRVLYTPFASVAHHGHTSINAFNANNLERQFLNLQRGIKERDYMLRRWLPRMANDPAMNPHLVCAGQSLKLDTALPIVWDSAFHDCPRIYGYGDTGGVGRYRVGQPLAMLEQQGHSAVVKSPSLTVPSVVHAARMGADVFLLHNPFSDGHLAGLRAYRDYLPSMRRVAGIDDLVTAIPKESSAHREWQRNMRDIRSRLRKSLALCDRLIVSTEPLREFCAPLIDDIRVVPNRLRRSEWDGHTSLRGQGKKPRVGWVGALQHTGDLALIREVVRTLQHEVEWVFMGMWPEGLDDITMEKHEGVAYEKYPQTMAALNLDIALAPLADNDFNRCKSNLRLLEYGAMAWPVIASDVYPFRSNEAPVTRLENEAPAWIDAIRALVADPARAEREGRALRAWVDRHYWLDDHWQDWADALLR